MDISFDSIEDLRDVSSLKYIRKQTSQTSQDSSEYMRDSIEDLCHIEEESHSNENGHKSTEDTENTEGTEDTEDKYTECTDNTENTACIEDTECTEDTEYTEGIEDTERIDNTEDPEEINNGAVSPQYRPNNDIHNNENTEILPCNTKEHQEEAENHTRINNEQYKSKEKTETTDSPHDSAHQTEYVNHEEQYQRRDSTCRETMEYQERKEFIKDTQSHHVSSAVKLPYICSVQDKMASSSSSGASGGGPGGGGEWNLVDEHGQRIQLPQTMVFLGREDCDINIQSSSVDHRHAVLTFDHRDKKFRLKDLGSMHGTLLNDEKIPDDDYVTLEHLDTVRFGLDPMTYRMEKLPVGGVTSSPTPSSSSARSGSPATDLPAWATRDLPPTPAASGRLVVAECKGCIAEHGVPHSCGISESSPPPPPPPVSQAPRWYPSTHDYPYRRDYYRSADTDRDPHMDPYNADYIPSHQRILGSSEDSSSTEGPPYRGGGGRGGHYPPSSVSESSAPVYRGTGGEGGGRGGHYPPSSVSGSSAPPPPHHYNPHYYPPPLPSHHYPSHHQYPHHPHPPQHHSQHHPPPPPPTHYKQQREAAYPPPPPPPSYYCAECDAAARRGGYDEYDEYGEYTSPPAPHPHHHQHHHPHPPAAAHKSAFSAIPPSYPHYPAGMHGAEPGYRRHSTNNPPDFTGHDNGDNIDTASKQNTTTTNSSQSLTISSSKIQNLPVGGEENKLAELKNLELEQKPVRDTEEFSDYGTDEVTVTSVQKIAKGYTSPTSATITMHGLHHTETTGASSSPSVVSTATLIIETPTKDTDPVGVSPAPTVSVKSDTPTQQTQVTKDNTNTTNTTANDDYNPALSSSTTTTASTTTPDTEVETTKSITSMKVETAAPLAVADEDGNEELSANTKESTNSPVSHNNLDKYHNDPQYATTYMEISMHDGPMPPRKQPPARLKPAHTPPEKDSGPEVPSTTTPASAPAPAATAFTIDFGSDSTSSVGGMKESKSLSQFLPSKVRNSFKQRSTLGKERSKEKQKELQDISPKEQKVSSVRRKSVPSVASTTKSPHSSPAQQRRRRRPPLTSQQQHSSAAAYHSDTAQASEPSSEGEDLSIKSDITNARSTSKYASHRGPNRTTEMKSTSSSSKKVTNTGTFIIESSKAPAELAAKSSPTYTVLKDNTHHQHHQSTNSHHHQQYDVQSSSNNDSQPFDSSTFTRSRGKRAKKQNAAAGGGAATEPLHRAVVKSEQRNSMNLEIDVLGGGGGGGGVGAVGATGDNVSEAGTYTIEGDDDEATKDVKSARQSIDTVFGVIGENGQEIHHAPAAPALRLSSTEDDQGGCVEITGDAPKWVSQWASHTAPNVTRSHDSCVDASLSTVRPPPSTRRSAARPGTGRLLPTPPASASAILTTLRSTSFDLAAVVSSGGEEENEDGRQRATLTFGDTSDDGGGFFEVSYDAPSLSKDSPRRSMSRDRSGDEGTPHISPRYLRTASARSAGSMDTELLLKDTESVMKAMQTRVDARQQRSASSPPHKEELFLPIHDNDDADDNADDTDEDVSAKVLLNGDEEDEEEDIPVPAPLPAPRTATYSKPRTTTTTTKTDNRIWGSTSLGNKGNSKEKVLAHYHSRTHGKRSSADGGDSVGVSDDSESASVISTSTDYSAAGASPKVIRKASKPKGNITMTRTNRAFALRRQNADSDTETSTKGVPKRSTSLTRPTSAGTSRNSTHRAARPASAKESPRSARSERSDVSLGQKIVQKSRENQTSASGANFLRKDGGRHSLRTQKTTPAATAPSPRSSHSQSMRETKSSPKVTTPRGSRPSTAGSTGSAPHTPRSSVSGPAAAAAASKTQDYEAWKRRKSYDPRKSLAAVAKNKKDEQQHHHNQQHAQQQQNQRRTRSAGVTHHVSDPWGRSSLSSEESSIASIASLASTAPVPGGPGSRTASAEISHFSSSLTRDINSMTRQAHCDNEDVFKTYDDLLVSSVYQLSLKVRAQTDSIYDKLKKRVEKCDSPIDDLLSHNIEAANPELPSILYNLRYMEAKLKALEKSMFPESVSEASPVDQQEYQRNLERIQTELAGFRPIDKPTATTTATVATASSSSSKVKSHPKTRSFSKKKPTGNNEAARGGGGGGSDPLEGSDYY